MKTNKFENTIRQKLESISPVYMEDNWTSMQNYMNAQAPPSFWHKYSNQLGYAAAASVIIVSTMLYTIQAQKNKQLLSDVENLKTQVEMLSVKPNHAAIDKDYELQKSERQFANILNVQNPNKEQENDAIKKNTVAFNTLSSTISKKEVGNSLATSIPEKLQINSIKSSENYAFTNLENVFSSQNIIEQTNIQSPTNNRLVLSTIAPISTIGQPVYNVALNYNLKNRLASTQSIPQDNKVITSFDNSNRKPVQLTNVAQIKEHETIMPVLPIKSSYRFGVSYQTESRKQIKSLIAEVPVTKRFSISTGLSWLTAKPVEFFNELIFKEKNKKDFDALRPKDGYMKQVYANIKVNSSALQIPLTLAFRSSINKNLNYYVNAGTNITVSSKEKFKYDIATNSSVNFPESAPLGFEQQQVLPLINSLNTGIGIEKTWQPIVIQLEGYLVNYFTPVTSESPKLSPGIKVKVLYQFGKKLNNSTDFKTSDKI